MAITGSDYTDITAVAYADLSSKQFYIMRSTGVDTSYSAGNLTCALCIGASGGAASAKGVLQNDPSSYEAAIVRVVGVTKIVSGSTIEIGDLIACSTAGTAIISDTTGEWFFGKAESKSSAAGELVSVRLFGGVAPFMGSTA